MTEKQIVLYWRKSWIDEDASDYILFDEYVRRIENEEILKHATVTDNPIHNASDFYKMRNYIDDLCYRLVKFYGNLVNNALGLDYNIEQWNIIWNFLYDELFYWFYVYKKIEPYRNQNCYVMLCDEIDFEKIRKISWGQNPLYSATIASLICKGIGIPYKKVQMEKISAIDYENSCYTDVSQMDCIERNLFRVRRIFESPSCIRDYFSHDSMQKKDKSVTIGLEGMRFPSKVKKYIQQNVSNVEFIDELYDVDAPEIVDEILREKIFDKTIFPAENEFELILPQLMKCLVSVDEIENLKFYEEYAKSITSKWNYKIIVHSAVSAKPFLMCLAYAKKKGIQIYDVQHAGVYSINRNYGHCEELIYDRFLTWGWNVANANNIQALGINRITPKFLVSPIKKKGRILLVSYVCEMNIVSRGLYEGKYIAETKKFIRGLSSEKRKNLIIRTNTYTENSDLVEWVKNEYPDVKFEKWDEVKMQDSVRKSDIVVCDYSSSIFFESLVFGVHPVMFFAQKVIDLNDEFKPFYERFKENEIIMESGDEMAKKINSTNNIKYWLYNNHVNEIYSDMQKKLMMPNKKVQDIWVKYLGNLD